MNRSSGDIYVQYRSWLLDRISVRDVDIDRKYLKLIDYLLGREFEWFVDYDENRAADGLELRDEFECETGIAVEELDDILPSPCSVLEMMVSLAERIDSEVYDPEKGRRTGLWFWEMIDNLGLDGMNYIMFDRKECRKIVDSLLNRTYERDGTGGLFPCSDPDIDMRKAEIWYQMNVWLEENFEL